MRLRLYIYILCALAALPLFGQEAGRQAEMQVQADTTALRIGEQTVLHVRLRLPEGTDADVSNPGLPAEVEVLGVEATEGERRDGLRELRADYRLTCFTPGDYSLRPAALVGNDSLFADTPLALHVSSVSLEADGKPRPPHGIIEPEAHLSRVFVCLLAMLLLTTAMLFYRIRSNKANRAKPTHTPPAAPRTPPAEEALAAIEALKSATGEEGLEGEAYFIRLTAILRRYIRLRFGFEAERQTTGQILAALKRNADSGAMQELRGILAQADLAKFARHSASTDEQADSLLQALAFVEHTKTEDKPAQPHSAPKAKRRRDRALIALWMIEILLLAAVTPYIINLLKLVA